MYSGKVLMMGRGTARKHVEFLEKMEKFLMMGRGTARKHVEFLEKMENS
jgi:predicted transcriptional regulator